MTWCQVFDVAASITPKGASAYDWNCYTDRNGVVSIPNYLESNADRLRSRLLGLMHELGLVCVDGKSVVEHLAVERGFNLWWMSLLVEKSIYKSPRLFDCLRLLALVELLQANKHGGIELISSDNILADAIKKLCADLSIPFRWQHSTGSVAHRPQHWAKRLYRHLPRPIQAVLWLARYTVERWPLRRARNGLSAQGSSDITVFSYFMHLDTQSCLQGHFRSRQWEAVGELFNKSCGGANWFHHYQQSIEVSDIHTGLALLECFNRDADRQGRHRFIDSFLNLGIVKRTLRNFLASNMAAWRLRNVERELPVNDLPTWLWPLIKKDFWESVSGPTAAQNLLWIELFDAAIGVLPRQRLGFYLYENQGWEQAMIHAWRRHGHGKLIAVAHATVRYWDLRYFLDPRVFRDDTCHAMPLPTNVAINGPAASSALLAAGYPAQRLVEVEAQRYLRLNDTAIIHSVKSKRAIDKRKRVLVLGDITPSANDDLMRLLQGMPADLKKNFNFTVKPHPGCPISPADYPALAYQVMHGPLLELIGEYDIAYAANATSAALDVLLGGTTVVVQYAAGQINLSPLRGVRDVRFVATSGELTQALCNEGWVIPSGLADNFFWLDQSMQRWQALINQQAATSN